MYAWSGDAVSRRFPLSRLLTGVAGLEEIPPVKAVNRGCFLEGRARGFHDTNPGISHACDPFGVGRFFQEIGSQGEAWPLP